MFQTKWSLDIICLRYLWHEYLETVGFKLSGL